MANGSFVHRVKKAIDECTLVLNRTTKNPMFGGNVIKALYDPELPTITLYVRQHSSFDDLVLSLIHEAVHHLRDLPEYIVDENLDRVGFTSVALRWAAAEKIGRVAFRFPGSDS